MTVRVIVHSVFQSTCLREARLAEHLLPPDKLPFQSTCLREARPLAPTSLSVDGEFQSTCLREARPGEVVNLTERLDFNPRACVRHDDRLTPSATTC